jgi:hypothetical protein
MCAWIFLWLLAYPLAGALTNDGAPNAPRTLAGAPVFCLLAAVGVAFFGDWAQNAGRRIIYAAAAFACIVSAAAFATFYFTAYVHRNSNAWDSGTAALFSAIRSHSAGYERVCFAVRPAWYETDVYAQYYLSDAHVRWLDDAGDPACAQPGTLIAADQQHEPRGAAVRVLTTIADVDGARFARLFARPEVSVRNTPTLQYVGGPHRN